jgi:hypothetical protein
MWSHVVTFCHILSHFVTLVRSFSGFVAASLASMLPGGHFAEIGKRNIWSHAQRAAERADVAHSIVAVDFLPPMCVAAEMLKIGTLLAAGAVRPITSTDYVIGDLSQVKQI